MQKKNQGGPEDTTVCQVRMNDQGIFLKSGCMETLFTNTSSSSSFPLRVEMPDDKKEFTNCISRDSNYQKMNPS